MLVGSHSQSLERSAIYRRLFQSGQDYIKELGFVLTVREILNVASR